MQSNNISNESKMEKEYDHILNIDYDKDYRIELTGRESMIFSNNRENISLDGKWNFSVDVYDTCIRKRFFEEVTKDEEGNDIPVDFSFDEWEEVMVPSNWNTEKAEYSLFEGTGLYTRKFSYTPSKTDERVFLKVGAANYECRVWLNKKLVARHIGGYTPFFIEVTDLLKDENRLLIMVNNTRKAEAIPSLNFDWYNYGGIFRSVELIKTPMAFIKDFFVYLFPDNEYNKIAVVAKVEGCASGAKLFFSIPELGVEESMEIDANTNQGELVINAKPELWSPENPKLYTVTAQYNEDKIVDEIGFRQIKTEGSKILLNGKDIFLKGVCVHEEVMEKGRAVSEEDIIKTINDAKEMNCNFLRLTHYPHNEKMAVLADKLGILLWEEIPVYWALKFEDKETYENASNQLSELITRDKNRASVIIWSVGNENPDTDARLNFMKNLSAVCRKEDPSRLVSAACLVNIDALKVKDRLVDYIDIASINEYYGWYYRNYNTLISILGNSDLGKPIIISETGGEAVPGMHGDVDKLYTEECQRTIYENQFRMLDMFPYVRGISPWILYDYKTQVRINYHQKGINLKGLISKERDYKKLAYYTVKEYYGKKV